VDKRISTYYQTFKHLTEAGSLLGKRDMLIAPQALLVVVLVVVGMLVQTPILLVIQAKINLL
jgi:hypothetical protein